MNLNRKNRILQEVYVELIHCCASIYCCCLVTYAIFCGEYPTVVSFCAMKGPILKEYINSTVWNRILRYVNFADVQSFAVAVLTVRYFVLTSHLRGI